MRKKVAVSGKRRKQRNHFPYYIGSASVVLLLAGSLWIFGGSDEEKSSSPHSPNQYEVESENRQLENVESSSEEDERDEHSSDETFTDEPDVRQQPAPAPSSSPQPPRDTAKSSAPAASPSEDPFDAIVKRMTTPKYTKYTRYGVSDIELGMTMKQIERLGYNAERIAFDDMDGYGFSKTMDGRNVDIPVVFDKSGRAAFVGMAMTHVQDVPGLITDSFGKYDTRDAMKTNGGFAVRYVNARTVSFVFAFQTQRSGKMVAVRVVDREDYARLLKTEFRFFANLMNYIHDLSAAIESGQTDERSLPYDPDFTVERMGDEWFIFSGLVEANTRILPDKDVLVALYRSPDGVQFGIQRYQLRNAPYNLPPQFRVHDFGGVLQAYYPAEPGKIKVGTKPHLTYSWIDKNGYSVKVSGPNDSNRLFVTVQPPQKAAW